MTTKYFALLTNQGAAKLANAAALGTKISITEMAVGDGGGVLPTPDATQTTLIGEKRRASLNALTIDTVNSSQIIAEQIIPESEGGFWIREIGLYDADGVLIAVANCAETYKPQLQEGSGRTQTVRMILIVNSTAAVTLKIDPSVVLATRKYVDDTVIEVKSYADNLMAAHTKSANPHSQYLQVKSALKELADAGLLVDVFKNLGLGTAAKRDVGSADSQLPEMSAFTRLLSVNGYQKLPGGLIIQWGESSNADTSGLASATFPVAFPTAILTIQMSEQSSNVVNVCKWGSASLSLTQAQFWCQKAGTTAASSGEICRYLAIGY